MCFCGSCGLNLCFHFLSSFRMIFNWIWTREILFLMQNPDATMLHVHVLSSPPPFNILAQNCLFLSLKILVSS